MTKIIKIAILLSSSGLLASCASAESASYDQSMQASSPEELISSIESASNEPETTQEVTVDFYIDYNTYTADVRHPYQTQVIKNGEKLTKPEDPEAPFSDFPVFLGWAPFALIEDPDLLWDFDKDIVNIKGDEMLMFGIWDAKE